MKKTENIKELDFIKTFWDGEYWHKKPRRKQLDKSQDAYMKKCGYKVIRIKEEQLIKKLKEQ